LKFAWKENVGNLGALRVIGEMTLEQKSNEKVLSDIMDNNIKIIQELRKINEEKTFENQRITQQYGQALTTMHETVNVKKETETDLYKKFALVLNEKRKHIRELDREIFNLKAQIENYELQLANGNGNGNQRVEQSDDEEDHAAHSTDDERSHDGFSDQQSHSPILQTTTLNDVDVNNTPAVSDVMDADDQNTPTVFPSSGESVPIVSKNKFPSSPYDEHHLLELDDDQNDFTKQPMRPNRQIQKRRYVTGVNTSIPLTTFTSSGATSEIDSQPSQDELLKRI